MVICNEESRILHPGPWIPSSIDPTYIELLSVNAIGFSQNLQHYLKELYFCTANEYRYVSYFDDCGTISKRFEGVSNSS